MTSAVSLLDHVGGSSEGIGRLVAGAGDEFHVVGALEWEVEFCLNGVGTVVASTFLGRDRSLLRFLGPPYRSRPERTEGPPTWRFTCEISEYGTRAAAAYVCQSLFSLSAKCALLIKSLTPDGEKPYTPHRESHTDHICEFITCAKCKIFWAIER